MIKKTLEIHSENILPIIKKWLYSDKDVFIRELASNSCDAMQKVKILGDQGQLQVDEKDLRIDIHLNKAERTLTFSDTGIGMDAEEVQKYIAQIAFSGAEEFLSKYKTNNEKDQFIGHFGLGFYSAYMVAKSVEIDTLSYKEGAEPVLWRCDGSSEYTMETGKRQKRGTTITLFIDDESEEFLDEFKIRKVAEHYCAFLPYPIYLESSLINNKEPLWIKPPNECTDQDYLDFYRVLHPMSEDPLFWIHLNVDYPFHLKGILYFPKLRHNFDHAKNTVKLFCNRVFVSDNCKDVIADYLMVLNGVIDSPDIPLNVSRSYLQMDKTVRQLSGHISKKVSDSLSSLYKTDRKRFISCWDDVSTVVKMGILEDEKFYEKAKEFLIWKNTEGEWTTCADYLERNREKTKDTIFYTRHEQHFSPFLEVYKKQAIEVLCANSPIDPFVMQFLEKKISPVKFQRIDADIHESILDKDREKTILDESGRTEATKLADFIRSKLKEEHVQVEAKSLASESLPGFIMLDENQRRLRDYMSQIDPQNVSNKMNLLGKQTFVVNTNSPIIATLQKIDHLDPQLAEDMVKEIYHLALLSQRELAQDSLNSFITLCTTVLERTAELLNKK
jgi:molecular chaperone HtpG